MWVRDAGCHPRLLRYGDPACSYLLHANEGFQRGGVRGGGDPSSGPGACHGLCARPAHARPTAPSAAPMHPQRR
jgi:hypothetical protein